MVAVELYREAFRDLLNSNEHENSNTAVHVGEFLLSFLIFVRENSVTDVVFCSTLTGACPARGVWPRGATELPVDTDDDGVSALRSLRAASGRRAVVRLFFVFVWAISLTSCFVCLQVVRKGSTPTPRARTSSSAYASRRVSLFKPSYGQLE